MSKSLGNRLPERVTEKLTPSNDERENSAILVLTIDKAGYPHVALLSPYQVLVDKEDEIVFAVHSASNTAANLASERKCTLVFQSPPSVVYARCETQHIPGKTIESGHLVDLVFRAKTQEVLEDYSKKAPFISELRFNADEVSQWYFAVFRELASVISGKN